MSLGFSPTGNLPLSTFYFPETVIIRPESDVTAGAWLPNTGSDLYATIDEVTPDDGDLDYTTSPSTFEVKLNTMLDPEVSTGHYISYRIRGLSDIVVRLKQGATTIASWTHSPPPASFTTFTQELATGEADSITNYADLRVEIESL